MKICISVGRNSGKVSMSLQCQNKCPECEGKDPEISSTTLIYPFLRTKGLVKLGDYYRLIKNECLSN